MHKSPTTADDTLFGDSPVPRYAQLSALFRRRIGRGEWPPGAQLPTLERLTAEFGVARVTVRQAIRLPRRTASFPRSAAAARSSPGTRGNRAASSSRRRSRRSPTCIATTRPSSR